MIGQEAIYNIKSMIKLYNKKEALIQGMKKKIDVWYCIVIISYKIKYDIFNELILM